MAQETITRLIAALNNDAVLKSKILAARSPEEATRIAVASGYDVTVDELIGLAEPGDVSSDAEMSDAELAGASAGIGLPMKMDLKGIGIRLSPSLPGRGRGFAEGCSNGLSSMGCTPGGTDG